MRIAVAGPGDEELLLELQQHVDVESEMLYLEPGERPNDPATLSRRLAGADGPSCFSMLALTGVQAVGYASVLAEPWRRVSATGLLSIAVRERWQGQGVGRRLLESTIAECRRRGLHRLELTVRADNARARELYLSAGFQPEGTRREAVTVRGVRHDEVYMAVLL